MRATSFPEVVTPGPETPPAPPPDPAFLPPTQDPGATAPPFPTDHADPALEARIAVELDGIPFQTFSIAGDQAANGAVYMHVVLERVDRTAGDLTTAVAADPSGETSAILFAVRIREADARLMVQAFLDATDNAGARETTVDGRDVRVIEGEGAVTYSFPVGDVMFLVQAIDQELASEALRGIDA